MNSESYNLHTIVLMLKRSDLNSKVKQFLRDKIKSTRLHNNECLFLIVSKIIKQNFNHA